MRRPTRRPIPFPVKFPLLVATLVALASCSPKLVPPGAPSPAPRITAGPSDAIAAGVTIGPALRGVSAENAERAFRAFRISCPSLLRREDVSGLTENKDWRSLCEEEPGDRSPEALAAWFESRFALVQVGDGRAFATGYYEPQIAGSRARMPGYEIPLYRKPEDLVEVDAAAAAAAGTLRRGRLVENALVPYYERAEIEDGILAGRGLEIAWAADPIDTFFLQIQGSGRLLLPDGSIMRIGYSGQNGREYVGIGKLMKDRGLLGSGPTSMQAIVAWLRANPEEGRALMRENKSYVFFQELTGPGPLGALGLPVTPRTTVAADPKFVPLGAPVLLQLDRPEANGLWIAQDTGGAIRGANRFDTFWGTGEQAALIAGGMQGRGRAWILLPKSATSRLRV